MRILRVLAVALAVLSVVPAQATLSTTYYDQSCPGLQSTVKTGLNTALESDVRVGASLLRMHFHDCFVQGCDASILLNDTSTFIGEQTALPNAHSLRGFGVVDDIKSAVEAICPATVSCADLLALIARDAVVAAGGPSWEVEFGRLDSTTASLSGANADIPAPVFDVAALTSSFAAVGLDQTAMVALSGAHTFGKGHCSLIQTRLYNFSGTGSPDPTLNSNYLATLRSECPETNGQVSNTTVVNLDPTTPTTFDNAYYLNLLNDKGLFTSDETLETEGGATARLVSNFAKSQRNFFDVFASSMIKMGEISPSTTGEVRLVCGVVN